MAKTQDIIESSTYKAQRLFAKAPELFTKAPKLFAKAPIRKIVAATQTYGGTDRLLLRAAVRMR